MWFRILNEVRTLAAALHGLQRRKISDRRLDTESAARPPATSPGQNPEFGPDRALQELIEARSAPDFGQNHATSPPGGADLVLPVSYRVGRAGDGASEGRRRQGSLTVKYVTVTEPGAESPTGGEADAPLREEREYDNLPTRNSSGLRAE